MSTTSYNMIRIVGTDTWLGVDVARKELMMQRDEVITIIADFRSIAAAELMDMWLVSIAKKFAPARRPRRWL